MVWCVCIFATLRNSATSKFLLTDLQHYSLLCCSSCVSRCNKWCIKGIARLGDSYLGITWKVWIFGISAPDNESYMGHFLLWQLNLKIWYRILSTRRNLSSFVMHLSFGNCFHRTGGAMFSVWLCPILNTMFLLLPGSTFNSHKVVRLWIWGCETLLAVPLLMVWRIPTVPWWSWKHLSLVLVVFYGLSKTTAYTF